ncbi:PP2C family protein-serine/threonine phosphatase [Acidobacteria bacterium AH-259-D05]|nr:PP2C family protein-serine/threonine phosphatase [Acidobacteria bacterium AH-259-D05]
MIEFFHALRDPYTYDPRRNHYILFGIAWGLPVPLFSLGIHLYSQDMNWSLGNAWYLFYNHPVHFFFLLHPLFFAVIFGALGTLRRLRDERIVQVEQEKLQSEIRIAQEVQAQLFPRVLPPMRTLDYFGLCRPAKGLSGDYYDFLQLRPDQLYIALGDISGKGISAALLMASLQALLRSNAPHHDYEVEPLIADINRLMCSWTTQDKYATFFCGVYDDVHRTLTYVNAGHGAPMLFRKNQLHRDEIGGDRPAGSQPAVVRLESSGMPLGIFPDVVYQQKTRQMCPGDLLLVFSDGITEAMDKNEQEFGEARLEKLVASHQELSPSEVIRRILAHVRGFVGEEAQHDDCTVIVAKVK